MATPQSGTKGKVRIRGIFQASVTFTLSSHRLPLLVWDPKNYLWILTSGDVHGDRHACIGCRWHRIY